MRATTSCLGSPLLPAKSWLATAATCNNLWRGAVHVANTGSHGWPLAATQDVIVTRHGLREGRGRGADAQLAARQPRRVAAHARERAARERVGREPVDREVEVLLHLRERKKEEGGAVKRHPPVTLPRRRAQVETPLPRTELSESGAHQRPSVEPLRSNFSVMGTLVKKTLLMTMRW